MPAAKTQPAIQRQYQSGKRGADEVSERDGDHKGRNNARAVAGRDPPGQIQHDAGEEACFRCSEKKTDDIERRGILNQRHAHGDDAPADHNARDPQPGADFLHGQVARHLKQEIGHEVEAAGEAKRRFAEAKVLIHLQRSHADIPAIDNGDQVTDNQKRKNTPDHLPHRLSFYVLGGGRAVT